MAQTHLELNPALGDETIGRLHFVLQAASEPAGEEAMRQGLRFTPGESCVSASALAAYEQAHAADTAGQVNVWAVPPDFHAGYSVLSTAFISRAEKMVIGAPMRYAAARSEMTLYRGTDIEGERMKIESEIFNGSPLADHPGFMLDYRNALGSFKASPQLHSVLARLEVSAQAYEALDFPNVESALTELFECREPAQAVLVPTMVHELVIQTVESVVISKLRRLRWEGLAAQGYIFKEGKEEMAVEHDADTAAYHEQIGRNKKSAADSDLFAGELAWLKSYTLRQLELMRIELDGNES